MGEENILPCCFISKVSVKCIMYFIHNVFTESILRLVHGKNEIQLAADDSQLHGAEYFRLISNSVFFF